MHKLRRTRERQTVLPDCRIVRGHGYVPGSRVRMALSSIAGGPRATRRRFLRGAGSAAMGVPLSLALTRIAAAQTQTPRSNANTHCATPDPLDREALPVVGCGTWRTFDVGNDRAARAQGSPTCSRPLRCGRFGDRFVADVWLVGGRRRRAAHATRRTSQRRSSRPRCGRKGREAGIAQMEQSLRALQHRAST